MSKQPVILKAATGADFLAMLPTLARYNTRNSLVIVPFHGSHTIGAIRIDLPEVGHDNTQFAATVVDMVRRLEMCNGVAFVIYTDDGFLSARLQRDALFASVDSAFVDAEYAVKDAFLVAHDGWVNLFEREAPFVGYPLSEIANSPMAAQAADVDPAADAAAIDQAKLPDLDPAISRLLRDAIDNLVYLSAEQDSFGRLKTAPVLDQVTLIEELLRSDPNNAPLSLLARLVQLCSTPAGRDQFIIQAAFGASVGRRIAKITARLHREQARTRLSMDEVLALQDHASKKKTLDEEASMLTGETKRVPSHARIQSAIELLRRVIPNIEYLDRVGPLCALAWLSWALGRTSIASIHASMAQALDPSYRMAELLIYMFGTGRVPEWIYAAHDAQVRERSA